MVKDVSKRFLSLILAFLLAAALLPGVVFTAQAAELTGLPVEGLGASYDGDGTWSINGNSVTGSVTGESTTCSSNSKTSALTLTNNKDTAATLAFDYEILQNQNNGTIQIDGGNITAGGSFTKVLAPGATIKTIWSPQGRLYHSGEIVGYSLAR